MIFHFSFPVAHFIVFIFYSFFLKSCETREIRAFMHFTIEEFIIVWTRIDQVTFLDRLVLRLQTNTPALLLGLHIKMLHKPLFILQKQVRIKKIVARWLAGVKCLANGPFYDSQWSWRSFSFKKHGYSNGRKRAREDWNQNSHLKFLR